MPVPIVMRLLLPLFWTLLLFAAAIADGKAALTPEVIQETFSFDSVAREIVRRNSEARRNSDELQQQHQDEARVAGAGPRLERAAYAPKDSANSEFTANSPQPRTVDISTPQDLKLSSEARKNFTQAGHRFAAHPEITDDEAVRFAIPPSFRGGPERLAELSKFLGSDKFVTQFAELARKCRQPMPNVILGQEFELGFRSLQLDTKQDATSILADLRTSAASCEQILVEADSVAKKLAPRVLDLDIYHLVSKNLRTTDSLRWLAVLGEPAFLESLRRVETSCTTSFDRLTLSRNLGIVREGFLSVALTQKPGELNSRLEAQARQCERVFAAIAEFNRTTGLANGALLRVELDSLLRGTVLAADVQRWLTSLNAEALIRLVASAQERLAGKATLRLSSLMPGDGAGPPLSPVVLNVTKGLSGSDGPVYLPSSELSRLLGGLSVKVHGELPEHLYLLGVTLSDAQN